MEERMVKVWNPSKVLLLEEKEKEKEKDLSLNIPSALIILNQPFSYKLLQILWKKTTWHLCADGGANRLYDGLLEIERENYLPDNIIGDLDSIRQHVQDYYQQHGSVITHMHDQDTTDLTKCIQQLKDIDENANIIALGALSGRLDHTMACINTLYRYLGKRYIYLVTDSNMTFLLEGGEHTIHLDKKVHGPACGLIPMGEESIVTTTGLRWNVTNQPMQWGRLISTSNLVADYDSITIQTSNPLLFTIEVIGTNLEIKR